MIIKTIVVIAFILIIISLGSALLHLVKHKSDEDSKKTVKALTFRIALSVALFVFIYIMIATGLYTPHGIGARIHAQKPAASPLPAPQNKPGPN
jgi:O-antigen/teichoic acid export membrane protein